MRINSTHFDTLLLTVLFIPYLSSVSQKSSLQVVNKTTDSNKRFSFTWFQEQENKFQGSPRSLTIPSFQGLNGGFKESVPCIPSIVANDQWAVGIDMAGFNQLMGLQYDKPYAFGRELSRPESRRLKYDVRVVESEIKCTLKC